MHYLVSMLLTLFKRFYKCPYLCNSLSVTPFYPVFLCLASFDWSRMLSSRALASKPDECEHKLQTKSLQYLWNFFKCHVPVTQVHFFSINCSIIIKLYFSYPCSVDKSPGAHQTKAVLMTVVQTSGIPRVMRILLIYLATTFMTPFWNFKINLLIIILITIGLKTQQSHSQVAPDVPWRPSVSPGTWSLATSNTDWLRWQALAFRPLEVLRLTFPCAGAYIRFRRASSNQWLPTSEGSIYL